MVIKNMEIIQCYFIYVQTLSSESRVARNTSQYIIAVVSLKESFPTSMTSTQCTLERVGRYTEGKMRQTLLRERGEDALLAVK